MPALGLIGTFDELAAPERRLGRKVANFDLVAALLRHARAEELHFFLPFAAAREPFLKAHAGLLARPGNRRRVRLWPATALPAVLAGQAFLALHATDLDNYLPELCHLRNRAAAQPCPVTATTHTLSYWASRRKHLALCLPGARPFDAVFCTSQAARCHLAASLAQVAGRLRQLGLAGAGFAGQLPVVPLGVEPDEFGRETRAAARRALGLPPRRLQLICLGRLSAADKADLLPLVAVAARLARRHDLGLILAGGAAAGGTAYLAGLQAAAAELGLGGRLVVKADFPSGDKARLLAAADLLVAPTDNPQETFGLSLLEAMAAGLPVVAADYSGYRDLVAEGETGFLVPTLGPRRLAGLELMRPVLADHVAALQLAQRTALDLDALEERLDRLLGSEELRGKLGEAGRRRVGERFAWSVVVATMEAAWEELAARARQEPWSPPPPDVLGEGLAAGFAHFPSGELAGDARLAPGPLAREFRAGTWGRRVPPDLAGGAPLRQWAALLATLEAGGGEAPVMAAVAGLTGGGLDEDWERIILQGLKQGVFSLAGGGRDHPVSAPEPATRIPGRREG